MKYELLKDIMQKKSDLNLLKKKSYYYDLPQELIAQFPKKKRSNSRLLYLEKNDGAIHHHKFYEIADILRPDDIIVLNQTKVIPARLFGQKDTGAKIELLLLEQKGENIWKCLVKPGKKLKKGNKIILSKDLSAKIIDYTEGGGRLIEFKSQKKFWDIIHDIGEMPLPPYIDRKAETEDKATYQTVYAREKGSVAAPTAGLHFTKDLLKKLAKKRIKILKVLLHVGLGTFRPVKTDNIEAHKMHSEYCTIDPETAQFINKAKAKGHRIIAVGTTSTRTLESFAENDRLKHGSHWTDIFIYPGKKIQIIDGLITNFHMPESTLLMLVCAFAGYKKTMNAYKTAVAKKYRFFSYGDAMLIL